MVDRARMSLDCIIVGGGIIGCTAAFYLARAGRRVALVERGRLAEGTTGNSFAWANASTKTTDDAYHRLNAAGTMGYIALARELGAEALGISATGALQVVSRADGPGFRAMQDDFAALGQFGYDCEWLGPAALRAEAPGLTWSADAEALLLPRDMVIDAPRFTAAMARQARALGAEVLQNCAALALIADDDGRVEGVEIASGRLLAPQVILATGADTGQVLADLTGFAGFAARFPLRQVPGLLMTTPPLKGHPVNRVIYGSTTDELHLLPAPNGGIRIGSDDVDGVIWEDRGKAAMRRGGQALLRRAARVVPGLESTVSVEACRLQVGVRPYPEDGRSIIGPLPGAEGLWIVVTHSGITLAPAIAARLVTLLDREEVPDPGHYALERFAGF